jgi:hypothetical protein
MKIYLITKPQGKKGYFSFRRLLSEEGIVEYYLKKGMTLPKKSELPVKILFNQIYLEEVEIDERV